MIFTPSDLKWRRFLVRRIKLRAFRTLLAVKGDGYQWKVNPYEVFKLCADDLYEVLLGRIRRVKSASQLAADQEYWINCEKVVMGAREEM